MRLIMINRLTALIKMIIYLIINGEFLFFFNSEIRMSECPMESYWILIVFSHTIDSKLYNIPLEILCT